MLSRNLPDKIPSGKLEMVNEINVSIAENKQNRNKYWRWGFNNTSFQFLKLKKEIPTISREQSIKTKALFELKSNLARVSQNSKAFEKKTLNEAKWKLDTGRNHKRPKHLVETITNESKHTKITGSS